MSQAELLALQKKNNRTLNILDPPKDLSVSESPLKQKNHGSVISNLIKVIFSPDKMLPSNYIAIGDTKKTIKNELGAETDAENAGKPLTDYLIKKANKIKILREKHSTGSDARPSNLYVSQDSGPGPSSIIKDPNIIITPGTIMDPATKTKEGATYLISTSTNGRSHGTLPNSYVDKLNMKDVITGDIVMTEETTAYRIKIPTNIGGSATTTDGNDGPGMINALLDKGTFGKYTAGANPDGVYFEGNATKNENIFNLFNAAPNATTPVSLKGTATEITKSENEIKKYILVKELGDSLQVIWLKYILDLYGDNGTYNISNTVLCTGDTVVWYRCIINKIPVIITYMGETNFWRAQDNDAAMIAAFRKTIRDELISDNESVIQIIKEIASLARNSEEWFFGVEYGEDEYNDVVKYFNLLAKKLENLNKDALIFVENVPSIDGAKEVAARYHFINPFVKKGGHWRTLDKVTSLLPDGSIKFNAKSFKAKTTIRTSLQNPSLFMKLIEQEGGGQRGGARRRTVEEKKQQAKNATTKELREQYLKDRFEEWEFKSVVNYTSADDVTIQARVTDAKKNRDGTADVTGSENGFMEYEIETSGGAKRKVTTDNWILFSANMTSTASASPVTFKEYFIYLFVRDNFPEIFTYAAMMKKGFRGLIARADIRGISTKFSEKLTSDLIQTIKLEYTMNEANKILVTGVEGETIPADLNANELHKITKEAIFLANTFLTEYKSLLTKNLANFLAYAMARLFTSQEKTHYTFQLSANNYSEITGQEGGGNEIVDKVTDLAMDNYEIYYSMAIQAAYEDRNLTEKEFDEKLKSIEKEIKEAETKEIQTSQITIHKTPLSLLNKLRTLKSRIPMQNTMGKIRTIITPKMVSRVTEGGKRRFKKTQKKRKSKQRKTRRSRR